MFAQDELIAEMGRLKKFALRLTRNDSDADDLLQRTCLRAPEKKHYFEDGTNLFSWTSKIMFNLFVSDYRRKTKFETRFDPEKYLEKESVAPSQDAYMGLQDVKRAMGRLNAKHLVVLTLVCVEGRPYKETAETLQIPVGTVRSRVARMRKQLQTIMDAPLAQIAKENAKIEYTHYH